MADIQPSTRLGRQSSTHPPKLRDSCSNCASSKVKCSKEKPTCIRCSRRGLACEYTASKRTGRTSLSTSKIPAARAAGSDRPNNISTSGPEEFQSFSWTPPSHTPCLTPSSITRPSSQNRGHAGPDIWRTLLSPGASTGDTAMSPIGNNFDDLFASVFSTPLNEPSDIEAMPHQQTNPHALPSLDNLNDLAVSEQDQYQSQDMGAVDVSGFDSGFDSPLSEPRRCCLTMALEILTQLFPNAPTACSLSGNQIGSCKVPTIESVISENKQIIEAINNMLDCHCSQDEYLLAIISLIVFKVMAWYAAAAGDKSLADNGMSWTNSFVALSDRQRTNSFGEQVLHLPTTIGNYCVDGNDRSRMAAQLVLSELHRVQRLVNLLSKRLEAIRLRNACLSRTSSGSSSVADSGDVQIMEKRASPLSAPTFHQLEADLRKRLRTVSSDTIDILRLE